MANQFKMAVTETILHLHQRGWSQRRIALELGINRETVARHLRQARRDSKPANAPTGSAASEIEVAASSPAIGCLGRPSNCEPWRDVILSKLDQGLSAQRIYQDLVADHGFTSKYPSVRRFVRQVQTIQELPCRRLECAPGEEAQVDFGTGARIVGPDKKRRRSHVFRIVLSHSRKAYSEAVLRQTTENFLRCLENAWWHFGGVPRRLVLDNLKAAVQHADWFDPELNPKFEAFCRHYGIIAWPLRPRKPEHKGKVERGVGYVQDNALKAREFTTLEEQNRHLLDWEATIADTRIHGTTQQQVGKHFLAMERPALQALPMARFPFFHEGQRTVSRDGHIEVHHAYYSVPPEYLYRRVWVRWDGRFVRIFDERLQPIATHVQREPGRFSTHDQHVADEKISAVERGAVFLLKQIRRIGPHATRWAESLLAQRGVEAIRTLQGLKSLVRHHPCEHLEEACRVAHAHGSYRLRTLRQLLGKRSDHQQRTFAFLEEHPLIRPLADYDRFVQQALTKETSR